VFGSGSFLSLLSIAAPKYQFVFNPNPMTLSTPSSSCVYVESQQLGLLGNIY
jgi:hypothetical protein